MPRFGSVLFLLPLLLFLAACGAPAPKQAEGEVARLAAGLIALDAGIDPEEAQRAAFIAIEYPKQLREEYGVTDPPLIHNMKVNSGLRPRGLCWHWAEDLQIRLHRERFRTLTLHRAIANADNPARIDHSTVIISGLGQNMQDGMVLDPWRYGGTLFWAPVLEDRRYRWVDQGVVFARKRARAAEKARGAAADTPA